MNILFKGMEMPQNCEECDVKAVCKNYWKLIREQHTRPSWCPLVPAADVGSVVRGNWIKTNEQECGMFTRITWKCSVCGIEVINTEPVYRIDDWHFCPNCGADMQEEI